MCKFFELNQFCKFGDNCAFAHGSVDLRNKASMPSAYRTKKCKQFSEYGYCPYGSRCQFAHQINERKSSANVISYSKTFKLLSSLDDFEKLKANFDRPRLTVFRKISGNKNKKRSSSTLLNDLKIMKEEMKQTNCFASNTINNYGSNSNDEQHNESLNRSRIQSV